MSENITQRSKFNQIDLENNLLGSCINDGVALVKKAMSAGLTPDTFIGQGGENAKIFDVMCELANQREDVDAPKLTARLPELMTYIYELAGNAVSSVLFDEWCRDLKTFEGTRMARYKWGCIDKLMEENMFDTDAVVRGFDALKSSYVQMIAGHRYMTFDEGFDELYKGFSQKKDFTSIPLLKGFTRGIFRRGETFVIGARTGTGKTAFAAGAANLMIDEGLTVLYVCGESSTRDIVARIVSARCGVPHDRFYERTATRDEWQRFLDASAYIKKTCGGRIGFHCLGDGLSFTANSIEDSAKQLRDVTGSIDVVIIDFLGVMHPNKEVKNGNKVVEVGRTITELHDMFGELGAAGLVLCQYQRQGSDQSKKKDGEKESSEPQLSWLRDSGEIENLAHAVAHIVTYKDESNRIIDSYLVCNEKHRNIKAFNVRMRWNGGTYEFEPRLKDGTLMDSDGYMINADATDVPEF